MDFDPGFHEEMIDDSYEEGLEDGTVEENMAAGEGEVEYDDEGNPVYLAVAAGFGHHMAEDSLEERQIAEDILKRRNKKETTPTKVPLSQRHKKEGYVTPFGRWARRANVDPAAREEGIEYTMEEKLQIIRAQFEE